MWKVLALSCVLGSIVSLGFAQPPPNDLSHGHAPPHRCLVPPETVKASFRNCATKLGIRPWEMRRPEDTDFDDKCFHSCVWEDLKLVGSDGDILDAVFKAHLTKLAEANEKPSDLVVEIAMKCVETTRAEFSKNGGISTNKCKFAAKTSFCIHEEDAKLC